MWITNGSIADLAVVWAQTDDGIRGFLVERGMKGFEASEIDNKFSLRASVTSSLFFDDVRVPAANVLPAVIGLKGPLSCLTQARYGICWGVIGAAQACLAELLEYTGFARTVRPQAGPHPGHPDPPRRHEPPHQRRAAHGAGSWRSSRNAAR